MLNEQASRPAIQPGVTLRAAPRLVQRERSDRVFCDRAAQSWLGDLYASSADIALLGFLLVYLSLRTLNVFSRCFICSAQPIGERAPPHVFGRLLLQRWSPVDDIGYGNVSGDSLREHRHGRRSAVWTGAYRRFRGFNGSPLFFPGDGSGDVQQGRRRHRIQRVTTSRFASPTSAASDPRAQVFRSPWSANSAPPRRVDAPFL